MFNNKVWFSGQASEELINNTICIYDSINKIVYNILSVKDLNDKVFVYICNAKRPNDSNDKFTIHCCEYVRCMRVHVLS